ncbi:MAG: YfhO family protein [Candidatus Margulisiibacteriota bacterium]|nr:YfhO family protein [Candidatus Margulisiibacteriota bacterium]
MKNKGIVFLFLLAVLLFFGRFLTGEQIFAFKDLSRYFYPLRQLMVEQVKAGQLPLWNPYIFCGFPLLATLQVGFFYPLTIIHYFLPFNLGFNYYMILHYFLAACFMFYLLRHYDLSKAASFLGGIVFAFSGYLLSVSNMNTSLSSVIWLPLTLLFFDRLIKEINFRNIVILGILIALQFLGGEPTIIYVTVIFLAVYGLIFSQNRIKSLGGLFLSGLISLGLTAVQLIPFLELAQLSDRVVRTGYDIVTMRSFPPREIISFIFPYFFGNPAHFGSYTETLLGKNIQDWLISPYIGILPLIFTFFSFKKRKAWFFLGAALFSLLLAFGRYTPIYRTIFFIPGISMIRYPVKYLFLTTFCLTILASFGFERLIEYFDQQKNKLKRVFLTMFPISLLSAVLFYIGFSFRVQIFNFFLKRYPANIPEYFFKLLARIIEFNLLSLFNITLYLLVFTLILWLGYRSRIKKGLFLFIIIVLVIADLFSNGYSIVIPAGSWVFETTPDNYRLLQKEKGLYRFFYTPELEEENRLIYGENYENALFEAKSNFAANRHIPYHFYDFYGYTSIRPAGYHSYFHTEFKGENLKKNIKDLSLFNVKYIASSRKLKIPCLIQLMHKEKYGLNVYLYENLAVKPRAYMESGRGEIVQYTPNEVVIVADAGKNELLFLSDRYYPGWKAFVDGEEVKIFRANNFFRSIKLEPGEHKVRFVYDPLSLKIGFFITLSTILLLFSAAIIWRKR